MLAVEQLHANALLVVLISAALAIVSLRAAVYFCQRALLARDRQIIARLLRSTGRTASEAVPAPGDVSR
jgi:hypothetical protein